MDVPSEKTSIFLEALERDRLHIELCLLEFLSHSLDLFTEKSFSEAMSCKNMCKMIFMICNDHFADLVAQDSDEEAMLDAIRSFLQKKQIPVNVICDVEKLQQRDPNEVATFMIDVFAMIKVFAARTFKYHSELLDPDVKAYINELCAPTIEWLEESLEKIRMENIMEENQKAQKNMERNFKELYKARILIEELQEANGKLVERNDELENRLGRLDLDMLKLQEKIRLLEETLGEKDKENLELIERFEDVAEENKTIKNQSHQLKERCNEYILSEEDYIAKLSDKDLKIQKLYLEIEESQKSINLFELQLKEFSKLVVQYKNEKESFQKRKEILNALQKSNHDKNEMLYYFNHKNHQLVVEKQKLDQYIKLCQYQIKKLTDEEKRLKHENHVLKALNENLMELGREQGGETVVVVQKGGKSGKDNSKLVRLLKENIGVGLLTAASSKTSRWARKAKGLFDAQTSANQEQPGVREVQPIEGLRNGKTRNAQENRGTAFSERHFGRVQTNLRRLRKLAGHSRSHVHIESGGGRLPK